MAQQAEEVRIAVEYGETVTFYPGMASSSGSIYIRGDKETIKKFLEVVAPGVMLDKWGHGAVVVRGAMVGFNAPDDPSKSASAAYTTPWGLTVTTVEKVGGGTPRVHYLDSRGGGVTEAYVSVSGESFVRLNGAIVHGLTGSFNALLSLCNRA